jgi:hypothetical protein
MSRNIELLEAVCDRMRQVGLTESKADFSRRMLGKAASYLTSTKARNRQIPEEVIDFLKQRLETDISAERIDLMSLQDALDSRALRQKHRVDLLHWIDRHGVESNDVAQSSPASPFKHATRRLRLFHIFRFS